MKILVTGGAGFIGSTLVPQLLAKNHQVRVLDKLIYNQTTLFPHFLNPNFEFIEGDIRQENTVKTALKEIEFVVHLAAIVGAPACKKDERSSWEINYEAACLINKLRGQIPLFFPSSTSGYGTRQAISGLCTEETPQEPISLYGKSKAEAEKAILDQGNCVTYRFATGYGISPRLRLDLMPNDFVFKAVKNKTLVVFERHFKRAFIHVQDMAKSIIFAIENFDKIKNNAYNCGSEEANFTKEELCLRIQKQVDYVLFFSDKDFDPDKRNYQISFAKIKQAGFNLSIDIDNGISELIKAFSCLKINSDFANVEYY
ncbi:MAG: NAD(P)-dependent oxidoreductase [Pseudomonadota bacterium]